MAGGSTHRRLCGFGSLRSVFFFLYLGGFFFNSHVAKFVGIKDFSAVLALDVFGVFLSRDNSHSGMLADGIHVGYLRVGILFRKIVTVPAALSNPLIEDEPTSFPIQKISSHL